MAIQIILDGDTSSAVQELHDLEIIASVEEGNVNARITTEQITLVNQYAALVRNYISGGVNGSTNGIFEGLNLEMLENGTNVFDGYLDFLNDFEIVNPTTVKARIKKHDGNNNFRDRASGLTFGYLDEINAIGPGDYLSIPYINEKEFNYIEFAFLAFSIYNLTKDSKELIEQVIYDAGVVAADIAGGVTGAAGGAIMAAAVVAVNAAIAAFMLILLANLIGELIAYIVSPIKYHKGIYLKTLAQKGCQHLGYSYNTSIGDLDYIAIMPSKTGVDKDATQFKIINTVPIHQPGVGYPSAADFGYTLWEVIELINKTFYSEYTIKNGVVEQHVIDSAWWIQNSVYILPDILQESIVTNANELISDKIIVFKIDETDTNSLEYFKGHTYEIRTRPISTTDSRNVLMNGYNRIDIPYELPNRKDKLNSLENFALTLFQNINAFLNFFGGNAQSTAWISNRIGVNMLSSDLMNVPKMMKLNNQLKLNTNNRSTWSAKYLYNNFHKKGSFVLNNFGNQYLIYKNVRIPFGFKEFNELSQNSYFSDSNGRLCKLEEITWNVSKDFALINYRVKEKYTGNLQEVYIEES
jgi:hypothetical protein